MFYLLLHVLLYKECQSLGAFEMYEAPTIFYLDETDTVNYMAKDLEEHGISTVYKVQLSSKNIQVARQHIGSELTTPFIYFPAESKTDLKKVAKYVGAGAVAGIATVVAAPLAFGAAGFSTGVVAGSVAAGVQSLFYGGLTGGVFSILQPAGVAGYGIFANTVIGMAGASLGMGFAKFAFDDNLKDFEIKVDMQIYGLCNTSVKEMKYIEKFAENLQPKDEIKVHYVKFNIGLQGFLRNITPVKNEVHVPAVIVSMKVSSMETSTSLRKMDN